MDKIQFDIKYRPEIEAGKYKVVTKACHPVRILCWDANCKYPIVGLIGGATTGEYSYQWNENGRSSIGITFNYDLVLVPVEPEPELTDFEKCVKECLEYDPEVVSDGDLLEATKEYAKELLALARKEIEDELKEKVLHDYWKQVSDRCTQARKDGKAEALKDLPRWRKCVKGELIGRSLFYDATDGLLIQPLDHRGYAPGAGFYIFLDELTKLPKEDEK